MNKLIRFIYVYLIVGLPFVIACMIWSDMRSENEIMQQASGFFIKAAYEILAWNLMIWFAVLIIFLAMLVAVPSVRENTLRHLANLKERDEREEYITGKASRAAYISTLSLMLFFLFFSLFSLTIVRFPADQVNPKRHMVVNISIGASLWDSPKPESNHMEGTVAGEVLFATKNIMPSSTSILIILLAWQLLIFNYTARKEQKKGFN